MKKVRKVTKSMLRISIDKKLDDYMSELFSNKSRYIEWLIHQDLIKNGKDVKKIIL